MKAPSAVRSMSDVSNSLNQQQVLKSKKSIFHIILTTSSYLPLNIFGPSFVQSNQLPLGPNLPVIRDNILWLNWQNLINLNKNNLFEIEERFQNDNL